MSNELILSLGWTLLHSLWQIGLLGLCTLGLERLLRHYSAQVRHQLLLFMLGGMVLACGVTLFQEWRHFVQVQHLAPNLKGGVGQINPNVLSLKLNPLLNEPAPLPLLFSCKVWIEQHLFWIVAFWFLGVLYFSMRFSWNYWSLQQLRRQSSRLEDSSFLTTTAAIQKSLGLRKNIRFYLHPTLSSPLTFGHFRPVILLPISLICQTSPELLDALLRHELIHIRRADFVTNLLLSTAQVLFFYHPIIWLLTRRMQELREEACDEAVVNSGCPKLVYAEALLCLQKLNHHQNIPLVMQAQNQPSHFSKRVRQILERSGTELALPYAQFWSTAVPVMLLLILLGFGSFKPTDAAETPSEAPKLLPQSVEYLQSSPTPLKPQNSTPKQKRAKALPTEKEYIEFIRTARADSLPQKTNDMVLSVAAERMNVLYIGVDNPISVALSGIPAEQVKVSSREAQLMPTGKGKYVAKVGTPGRATILVEAPNYRQEVVFRVKPIPDPVAVLGNSGTGGFIRVSELTALKSIESKLFGFDMDAQCGILGFSVIYIEKGNDSPKQGVNPGGAFTPTVLELLSHAKDGDQVIFDNIRAKCPGDAQGRKINNLAFKIIADPEKKE